MSGCHDPSKIEVPAMSGFDRGEGDQLVMFCLDCKSHLNDCKCVWAVVRDLQESYQGLFADYNHLEDAIVDLRKESKEIHQHIYNLHDMVNMEDRITASDVLLRLTQLETNVDFEKAKELIYQGAQTHATILKLTARVKDIEYHLEHIIALPGELDLRLQEGERLLDKWSEKIVGKKPHKCPVCDGDGNIYMENMTLGMKIIEGWSSTTDGMLKKKCQSCDGNGIAWG